MKKRIATILIIVTMAVSLNVFAGPIGGGAQPPPSICPEIGVVVSSITIGE